MHATRLDNFIGWVGALLVVSAYIVLTWDIADSKSLLYNLMNLIGGAALGYRVWVDRNYSNLFLEVIFVGVAIYALMRLF